MPKARGFLWALPPYEETRHQSGRRVAMQGSSLDDRILSPTMRPGKMMGALGFEPRTKGL
jgi:hypothetical protein